MHIVKEALLNSLRSIVQTYNGCVNLNINIKANHEYDGNEQQIHEMIEVNCNKALEVFYNKFNSFFNVTHRNPNPKLRSMFAIYEALSILNPHTFHNMYVGGELIIQQYIDTMFENISLLFNMEQNAKQLLIQNIKAELPIYFAHSENASFDIDVIKWWFEKRHVLRKFYESIIPIAVIFQPTSAAAERVFAMLKWMFGEDQASLLQDYKESSLIMR